MKFGKFIHLGEYEEIKIGYGTVDFRNLKTVYVKLNSWVMPTDEMADFDKTILRSRKKIKDTIREHNLNNLFKKESIVDLDIRTKGIKLDKKSFMNLEVTLFAENQFDIKSKEIKNTLKNLIESIVDNCLIDRSLFNFSKTKF
jgi:hypothetical protein